MFDGGYAFNDIPAGEYVVEIVPPPGYELTKEEDVNVGSGDGYATPPITVGAAAEIMLPDPAMVEAALLAFGSVSPNRRVLARCVRYLRR